MKENPVKVTDTVLRDAHQSLLATRLRTEDMLPIATRLDEVGYHSLEVWGGATFDTCLRFLHEDPWERLRQIKSHIRKTPLQMLLRGQNIVGYRHYPDDIVERFVAKARQNGIDIFRIFDALNDIRNMELAMKVACREGAHVQAAICYTLSPVHNIDLYVQLAKQLESLGAHSICIKDMAGMLAPYEAYELITRLKESLDLPIQLHCHYTSGMAQATYLKAAEAGIDIVDTAISTMALGSSQPPTESFVSMLRGTPRDTGLDLTLLSEIAQYFAEVRRRYRAFESEFSGVDTNVLVFQIPGGMISNLAAQLQEQGALDKMPEVLREVPQVRQELGYPPLVTPSSQIVGTQATLNVLLGKRYKVIPKEVKSYIKGLYGRPPAPVDERIRRLAIDDEETVEQRPADLLPPEYAQAAKESAAYSRSEEDVLSYALFPSIALEFFKGRAAGEQLEQEVVAAIAAAISHSSGPKPPTSADRSLWRMTGRLRSTALDELRWIK